MITTDDMARHARPDEAPRDWYFTFGTDHPLFAKRYVKIHGTAESTRETMFSVFDRNWAFQYPSAEAAGVEKYGLTEI